MIRNKKYLLCMASAALAMSVVSCADGIDPDTFSADVTNQELSVPVLEKSSFSTVQVAVGGDLKPYTKMTWPVVHGASGYKVTVDIVDDPEHPKHVVPCVEADSIIDGCSLTFPQEEETRYQITIQALGRKDLNNRDSRILTYDDYTTLVPATFIGGSENLAAFIKSQLKQGDISQVQAFELQGGATYTVEDTLYFGNANVQFRGDKSNRPTICLYGKACIVTEGPLEVKFINFECKDTKASPISLSPTPSPSLYYDQFGYTDKGANQKPYYLEGTVLVKDCNFSNVSTSFFSASKASWSIQGVTVNNCIIETNYEQDDAIFSLYGSSSGSIKDIIITNSTIYNLNKNCKGYFLRFGNASNALPNKQWGAGAIATVTFTNNTIVQAMTNTNWWNNYLNNNGQCSWVMRGNIFYDTWRIQKAVQNNKHEIKPEDNVIWGVTNPVDGTDLNKFATESDPGFTMPSDPMILDSEDCGLKAYFTPKSGMAADKKYGDPRYWKK